MVEPLGGAGGAHRFSVEALERDLGAEGGGGFGAPVAPSGRSGEKNGSVARTLPNPVAGKREPLFSSSSDWCGFCVLNAFTFAQ